jgi:hypothetical protein
LVVVGNTAAGSGSSTNLITIQGNAGGTPVPISGSITATNASVLAYQVDSTGSTAQLSIVVERSSWTDADLQAQIRTLSHNGTPGANIGAYGNVFPALATVTSTGGLKLA